MKNDLERWFKTSKHKRALFSFCNIIVPLIIGATVYVLFVPTAHISIIVFNFLGKSLFTNYIDLTGSIITCFFADFLWAYSLFFLVLIIYAQKASDIIFVIIVCINFEIAIEFLQLTPIIDGTFDWLDIVVEILATLFGFGVLITFCFAVNKRGHFHDCNIKQT